MAPAAGKRMQYRTHTCALEPHELVLQPEKKEKFYAGRHVQTGADAAATQAGQACTHPLIPAAQTQHNILASGIDACSCSLMHSRSAFTDEQMSLGQAAALLNSAAEMLLTLFTVPCMLREDTPAELDQDWCFSLLGY